MFLEAMSWPPDDFEVLVLLVDELVLVELDDEGMWTPRRLAAASAASLTSPVSSFEVAELRLLAKPEIWSEKKLLTSAVVLELAIELDQSGMLNIEPEDRPPPPMIADMLTRL
jgi:hypothetical protein